MSLDRSGIDYYLACVVAAAVLQLRELLHSEESG